MKLTLRVCGRELVHLDLDQNNPPPAAAPATAEPDKPSIGGTSHFGFADGHARRWGHIPTGGRI